MGMDLTSDSGDQTRFTGYTWALVLNLAEHYGWHAPGTAPPDGWQEATIWPRSYDTNEGGRVRPEDARALAEALDTAIASSEFDRSLIAIDGALQQAIAAATNVSASGEMPDKIEWLQILTDFAAFCRNGGFRID